MEMSSGQESDRTCDILLADCASPIRTFSKVSANIKIKRGVLRVFLGRVLG